MIHVIRTPTILANFLIAVFAGGSSALSAQEAADTTQSPTAQDGLYDRPFIGGVGAISIGGYIEGNSNYFVEDGIGEGFSMELRRFDIFLYSTISRRVRFLAELEFEHGTKEIALETALVDFQIDPALTLRAGIFFPPLGYVNQNHDSPKWDFVERPLVTTDIIPSTLSEVGVGAFGRTLLSGMTVTYDAYLTNGLGEGIIGNDLGRTNIPSGKDPERFEEDNNGSPALSGRLAASHSSHGEIGLSYYRGVYNSYKVEGEVVDDQRYISISAIDVGTSVGPLQIRGEAARATIDVPSGMQEIFGDKQWGAHVDFLLPIWHPRMRGYADAVVTGGLRIERVDYNQGSFASTGRNIHDDVTAVVASLSFRPTPGTVFRANYRYHWIRDFVGNPTGALAGLQFGFATYF